MPPISDLTLGSRLWVTDNLVALQDVFEEAESIASSSDAPLATFEGRTLPAVISGDSVLTSLAAGPDSAKLKGVFAGAKLLGKLIDRDNDAKLMFERYADEVAGRLKIDRDGFAKTIARMNRALTDADSDLALTDDEIAVAKNALDKILGTAEMDRRSAQGELSKQGRLGLANAALGVIKLMRDGVIGEHSTTELFDNEIYDITKPADMLKLSSRTARTARDIFVDRTTLTTLGNTLVAEVMDKLEGDALDSVTAKITQLKEKINELIHKRERLSKILDFEPDFGDGSESAIKKGLQAAKNAMRAFRYDLDQVTGRSMTMMERFRRMINNWQSRNGGGTVTTADYRDLVRTEDEINTLVDELSRSCGIPVAERMSVRRSSETSREACNLTHATNNQIRYYQSGIAAEKEEAIATITNDLADIAANGGSKRVSFGVGLDAKFAIKVTDAAQINAHADLKYERTASVSVKAGGGPITVTYYDGAAAGVDGKATVGKWGSTKNVGDVSGGLSVGAKAGGSIGKGQKVVYASLKDFAEDVWGKRGESIARQNSIKQPFCLGKICQGIRALGHGICNLVTALGFRIHHTKVDTAAFRAQVRSSGAIAKTDQILAAPLRDRVIRKSDKSYTVGSVSAGGEVKVKLDVVRKFSDSITKPGKKEADKSELFSASAGLSYRGERTFGATGFSYRSRLDSLRLQSRDFLLNKAERLKDVFPGLRLTGTTRREQFKSLDEKLTELEDSAALQEANDTDAWERTAQKYVFLTVQYALIEEELTSRLAALHDEDEEGNAAQIAEVKEELDAAVTFFEKRLTSPNLSMPEDVFNEMLVEKFNESHGTTVTHKVEFKAGYSALTEALGDLASDQVPGKGFLTNLGKTAASEPIKTIGNELMLSNEITGSVKTEKPTSTTDICPWKNKRSTDVSIKLSPNLPMKAIVEAVARKIIDSHLDDPEPVEAKKMLIETAVGDAIGMMFGIGVGTLLKTYARHTVEDVITQMVNGEAPDAVKSFFGAPIMESLTGEVQYTGIVPGFDMNSSKEFVFHFDELRLTSVTLQSNDSTTSKIGFHVQVAPGFGLGAVMSNGVDRQTIERSVYAHPPFDSLLARTEDFLVSGDRQAFKDFLAHNSHGALRMVRLYAKNPADPGIEFDNKNDREDAVALRERYDFVHRRIKKILEEGSAAGHPERLVDRAKGVLVQLERSAEKMRAATAEGGDMTDAKRLKALEGHLNALVKGFLLLKEMPGI